MIDTISKLRSEIDLVTAQIVSLLKKRFELLDDVRKEKVKMGRALQDPQREHEILSNVQKQLGAQQAAPHITRVISTVLYESLQYMGQRKNGKNIMEDVSVTKRFEFDSAHRLPNHQGLCRNIHGHRYVLDVTVRGPLAITAGNSDEGMVIDFHDLKKMVNEQVVGPWDHALLLYKNDPILQGTQAFDEQKLVLMENIPTAENMAVEIHNNLKQAFSLLSSDRPIKLEKIRLYETPTAWVEIG